MNSVKFIYQFVRIMKKAEGGPFEEMFRKMAGEMYDKFNDLQKQGQRPPSSIDEMFERIREFVEPGKGKNEGEEVKEAATEEEIIGVTQQLDLLKAHIDQLKSQLQDKDEIIQLLRGQLKEK